MTQDGFVANIKKTSVIIPAAGLGQRMQTGVRKPFLELSGRPILLRTCERLRSAPGVFEVIIAAHPDDLAMLENAWGDALATAGVSLTVAGGACRAESVWNALQVVSAAAELVAVHDAVRPFASVAMINELLKLADKRGAAIPIVPLSDTIKLIESDKVVHTPKRHGLVRVQTPQVFKSDLLIDAFEYALRTGGLSEHITDDAQLVENMGGEVSALYGEEFNFKITTPRDLKMAEALLAAGLVS